MIIIILAIIIALFGVGRIFSGYCAGSGVGMLALSTCMVMSSCGIIEF